MIKTEVLNNIMNDYLNKSEYETVKLIITKAFENSAEAFQRFLGKKVETDIEFWNVNNYQELNNSTDENFVLISELKGDIKGKCYLIFTHEEATKLFKNCLTDEYVTNDSMQNAILMELDNILTAAVVTVFSDKLKINSYAYVPKLAKLSSIDLRESLESDFNANMLVFNFNSTFKIEEITLSPKFIWAVELKFLDRFISNSELSGIN